MGNVLKDMGKANAARTYVDTGRGAYLAAAYLKKISGTIPDWKNAVAWAENQKEIRQTYWLGLMELYTPTEESVFPKEFMSGLKSCTDLNPVQTKIVDMMREALYKK